jgi:hypothetical protein
MFAALFQSCIEITETVTVNQDRSGTLSLSAGIGNQNPILALLGQYADLEIDDNTLYEVRKAVSILKSSDGISNVKFNDNFIRGNIELSFDFENDKKLNNALYAIGDVKKNIFQPNIYKIKSNKFVRNNTTRWMLIFLKQEEENLPDEALFDLVEVKSVYRFPDEIKSVRATGNYKLSSNNQSVATTHFLSDLIDDKINTRVKVKY